MVGMKRSCHARRNKNDRLYRLILTLVELFLRESAPCAFQRLSCAKVSLSSTTGLR